MAVLGQMQRALALENNESFCGDQNMQLFIKSSDHIATSPPSKKASRDTLVLPRPMSTHMLCAVLPIRSK